MCAVVPVTDVLHPVCGCRGIRYFEGYTRLTFCCVCSIAYCAGAHDESCCVNHTKGFRFHGATVLNDFISEEEEETLIKTIDESPWLPSQSGRNKQDFGVKVNFKKQRIVFKYFTGLPDYSRVLVQRLHQRMRAGGAKFEDFYPVELCNLEYLPERGAAISPHVDDTWLWGERIVLLNLASATNMTFTLPSSGPGVSEEWERYKIFASSQAHLPQIDLPPSIAVPLPRRSLLIMAGKARTTWLHAINREDISGRRLSLTMRELSNEYLPPYAAIREFAVCPKEEKAPCDRERSTANLTANQHLGLRLVRTAATFSGVCVAVTSGEGTLPKH
ncbi:hypothetical protein TcWFU_008639 [Taenia crassiceps]|uniref:Fe2OG dioxygenase domain-containing protein n=1 Tax=Taenia crassiceps TaxID=6207 RepID=A0ABR4QN04_9CEST